MPQKQAYNFYKAIRSPKDKEIHQRPRTTATLSKIAQGIENAFGKRLPEKMIWKSLRKRTITREARQFTDQQRAWLTNLSHIYLTYLPYGPK
ncbi:hypothetical protein GSI_04042 [Ganoderma sinense ZZ0214-1]|uniref:Uncharacterized protein n=1 Tax=Ganoderma sinense ZZ0214-1 TaxID=1077348 RepID=A0A2G8SI36_9APHY|nr:hypothetical protein GSI_04042 [Ganoderma sinense ZZ0214-1]